MLVRETCICDKGKEQVKEEVTVPRKEQKSEEGDALNADAANDGGYSL